MPGTRPVYSQCKVNAMDEPMRPRSPWLLFSTPLLAVPFALGLPLVVAAACSSSSKPAASSATKDSGGAGTDATDTTGDDAGEDAAPSCDAGCPATSLSGTTCVASVQASLVGTNGVPAA